MFSFRRAFLTLPLAGFLAAVSALQVGATTLTFDAMTNGCGVCHSLSIATESIVESGYTIGGWPAYAGSPGEVHLDDAGTAYSDFMSITGPGRFNVHALDLLGLGTELTERVGQQTLAYLNVRMQGFRGGSLVSESLLSTGAVPQDFLNMSLGGLFMDIDLFVISAIRPASLPPGTICGAPCGHFSVDNIVISPVPLPAGLPMLAFAILGAVLLTRRRRG